MKEIIDLPSEIIGILRKFLVEEKIKISATFLVWRNFLNTCKSLLPVKRRWIYFNLNKLWSQLYITKTHFLDRINSEIENPALQIHLRLSGSSGFDFADVLNSPNLIFQCINSLEISSCYLPTLSLFKGISSLHLINCEFHLSKSHSCSHLHSLSLINCKIINSIPPYLNISLFPALTYLEITDYQFPLDVSYFGSIPELVFNGCTILVGIEALTAVQLLHIRHCLSVEDLSMLQSVKSLDISFCSSVVHLGNLRSLRTLFVCPQTISLLEQITNCCDLHLIVEGDVAETLAAHYLESYQKLSLVNNSQIERLEGFPFLHSLTLLNLENLSTIADLPFLRKLSVYGCPRLCAINLCSLPHLIALDYGGKMLNGVTSGKEETLEFMET